MSLITSISGIRGTIGGKTGEKSLFDRWPDTSRHIALTAFSAVRMIRGHENRGIAKTAGPARPGGPRSQY